MKIHSITVVKNEADIIQYAIREALKWSDCIYVLDNGSDDGTWDLVQELASDRVIPWKSDDMPFRESVRGEVFNQFKERAEPGDWWCRLDADEFYDIQSPRDFLAKVPPSLHVVWGIFIEYYLTTSDLETVDFNLPIEEMIPCLTYYRANNTDARFFRHRKELVWPADGSWPLHMGLVHQDRILFRHYKYRSPAQIQTRLDIRRRARTRGYPGWDYAAQLDWKEKLENGANLLRDKKDGRFEVEWDSLAKHVEPFWSRTVKRVMHSTGLWP